MKIISIISHTSQALPTNPPIHIYINRISNSSVKNKKGYKLELQTPKTMKLFGSSKKLIDKTKTGENVRSFEAVEVVLVQCNFVDNQYNIEVSHFASN